MEPKRELVSPAVPRRAVQPPSSHRTLQQPSHMAEYEAVGLGLSPPRQDLVWAPVWDRDSSSVPPASYYEATPWWGAIPHTVRPLGPAWSGLRLNTPPPLMCTSPAPPNRADPFPRGPHAFRVLGGPTLMPCCNGHPGRMVVQLSAEEDLAVTCLLKLRYRDPEDPQVGWAVLDPPYGAAPPPSGAGWLEFRRPDDVEHYEEYLLPIPPPPPTEEHP